MIRVSGNLREPLNSLCRSLKIFVGHGFNRAVTRLKCVRLYRLRKKSTSEGF
jgi:hypothetical protein